MYNKSTKFNDVLKIDFKKCKVISYSYADDTVLLFSGKSLEDTYNNSNFGLKIINNWFDSNYLSLNTTKTIVVPFSLTAKCNISSNSTLNIKLQSHNFLCIIVIAQSLTKLLK